MNDDSRAACFAAPESPSLPLRIDRFSLLWRHQGFEDLIVSAVFRLLILPTQRIEGQSCTLNKDRRQIRSGVSKVAESGMSEGR